MDVLNEHQIEKLIHNEYERALLLVSILFKDKKDKA